MVSADPMSTVNDTNPETCDQLLPGAQRVAKDANQRWSQCSSLSLSDNFHHVSDPSLCAVEDNDGMDGDGNSRSSKTMSDLPWDHQQKELFPLHSDDKSSGSRSTNRRLNGGILQQTVLPPSQPSSCHTVCKQYMPPQGAEGLFQGVKRTGGPTSNGDLLYLAQRSKPLDFVTWLQNQHISLIIRVNRSDERGLIEHGGSYEPMDIEKFGIQHLDLPVLDKDGGVPGAQVIRSMMESHTGQPVLVHCKGGFGRSVVLAVCLLIHWHDVPGRALLGWSRIVRPGSITTPEQERFLCGLKGRADLDKFVSRAGGSCCTVS